MSQFSINNTYISGLKMVTRKLIGDSRGLFSRIFCAEELRSVGWGGSISQINITKTKSKGTIRGLHFQYPPFAEMKLVSCLHGEIWDVAVDLRRDSPTFLKWHAEILSAENQRGLLIPEGFAHGFQTLSDNCELLYLHSSPYMKEAEGGIRPNDPKLSIGWPIDFSKLSERDSSHPLLNDQFKGIGL